jgi:hypothetical protein
VEGLNVEGPNAEARYVEGSMKACRLIRRLSAALLLVALFLPLSRCSEQPPGDTPGGGVAAGGAAPSAPTTYRYYYAWTDFKVSEISSWLLFLAFLWPLPFLAHEALARGKAARIWVSAVQLPLGAGAITLIYYRTFLHQLWVGGYLAYIALGAYSLSLAAEIVLGIIMKRRPRAVP